MLRELGISCRHTPDRVVSVPLYHPPYLPGQPAPADDDIEDLIDLNDYLMPRRDASFGAGEGRIDGGCRHP